MSLEASTSNGAIFKYEEYKAPMEEDLSKAFFITQLEPKGISFLTLRHDLMQRVLWTITSRRYLP